MLGFAAGLALALVVRARDLDRAREIRATLVETGGWAPDALEARVGQGLHLRLTSDDVVHGLAVGRTGWKAVDVLPGEVTRLTLTFDEPGTYTFYCTRWCGVNHWRMRGTIEVSGSEQTEAPAADPPRYVELGLDIDAPHPAEATPAAAPSAALSGGEGIPDSYLSLAYYWAHSPARTWIEMRADPFTAGWEDGEVWDAVAWLWARRTSPERLAMGRQVFQSQCAACHGQTGAGDGVFADEIAAGGAWVDAEMAMPAAGPADLQDVSALLGAAPALLEGKILRGGMGTGMPAWGPILTDHEIRDVIAYLYTFGLEEGSQ
jgi:mono/diheme cytochrome c family protein/plastocyanin